MAFVDWRKYARAKVNDGKYNIDYPSKPFPGYLFSDEHPFTLCNSLTHLVDDKPSTNFSGNDGPVEFARHLETAPPNWHYRTKEVTYTVNASGYRTREWKDIDWKNSIVLLGCSNTFGIGLSDDETISYHLERLSGRPVINLGYPSASNELILNNCTAMLETFGSPYAVAINWSCIDRMRYYNEWAPTDLGLWNSNPGNGPKADDNIAEYWKYSVIDETNLLTKSYYLSKTAKVMFMGRSKYVTVSSFKESAHYMRADEWFFIDPNNRARDMIHPGAGDALKIAEYLNNKLNEQL
jgi:hypothetical protein